MYQVYRVTTKDGKIYIGCTKQAINTRMSGHRYHGNIFAIIEHTIDILYRDADKNKAEQVEAEYIKTLESYNPEKGYNRRLGGSRWGFADWVVVGYGKRMPAAHPGEKNGMYGRTHSEQTKRQISAAHTGIPSPIKGIKLPRAECEKRALTRNGKGYLRGKDHPLFGKILSAEERKRIGESAKGHKRWLGRKHSEESKQKMSETKFLKKLARSLSYASAPFLLSLAANCVAEIGGIGQARGLVQATGGRCLGDGDCSVQD